MEPMQLLDRLPLWIFSILTGGLVCASVELGYRIARRQSPWKGDAKDTAIRSMVGATLALLAFMLGFTFSMAWQRFDARRHMVPEEAKAVEGVYLRAAFIGEPERTEVRKLLGEYVDARLAAIRDGEASNAIARSEEIQGRLWSLSVADAGKSPPTVLKGHFIQSINTLIEVHTTRTHVALQSRIPAVIMYVLFFITILAMASMGYVTGLIGGKRIHLVTWSLVMAFSSVMFLIADLDRPHEGLLNVSQKAMVDLQKKLNVADQGRTAP